MLRKDFHNTVGGRTASACRTANAAVAAELRKEMDGRLHKHLLDGEKAPPDQLKAISLKVVIRTQTNSLPHARRVKSVRFIISLKLVRTQNSQFSNEITHLSNEIALFQMKSSLPRRAMRGCDASPRPSSIARGARLSRERREDAGGGARQEQK